MQKKYSHWFGLIIIFFNCICHIANAGTYRTITAHNVDTASRPPVFLDGGRTIDSLKNVYKCEAIEFENWEGDDSADATLTVCLINSNRVPRTDIDSNVDQLVRIAAAIKRSLKYSELYQSYYIIFVKKDIYGLLTLKSHTNGMDVPDSLLKE